MGEFRVTQSCGMECSAFCPYTPRESGLPQEGPVRCPLCCLSGLLDWDSGSECPLPGGLAA